MPRWDPKSALGSTIIKKGYHLETDKRMAETISTAEFLSASVIEKRRLQWLNTPEKVFCLTSKIPRLLKNEIRTQRKIVIEIQNRYFLGEY